MFVFVVTITLTPALSWAEVGPIAAAAVRVATQNASAPPAAAKPMKSPAMFWSGVALVTGGTVLATLSYTGLANDACYPFVSGGVFFSNCVKTTNWGVFTAGMAMIGTGAAMGVIGARRALVITPQRITYRW